MHPYVDEPRRTDHDWYGEDHGPANPHAESAGLARLVGDQWLVYERVQASRSGNVTHVALEGMPKTVCGRPVTFRYGLSPTDSISMIYCNQCRAYIQEHTL